ncbi:hypothetical protein EJB05_36730, partial [Eragrostis curvula]
MATPSWQFLLILAAAAAGGVLRVRSQDMPDSTGELFSSRSFCAGKNASYDLRSKAQSHLCARAGFISIDCGIPEGSSYVDPVTKLTYVSDAGFTDAGVNRNVSAEYIDPMAYAAREFNVRSFPGAAPRSCYTLGSLTPGSKYLIRAGFMYGNYDGLGRPPAFDLHLGVNFWTTMNITGPNSPVIAEVIAVVPDDFVQVCLVNTGAGTPFISGLDLRPLKNTLYPQANATQGLVLFARRDLGPRSSGVRYPDDRYDRAWTSWMEQDMWSEISTTEKMQSSAGLYFDVPSAVMQTAITPLGASNTIYFVVYAEPNHVYTAPGYVFILYFADLQVLPSNASRQFYITINGKLWYTDVTHPYTPQYLLSDAIYSKGPQYGFSQYNITLTAAANSTLPPIINAAEAFSVISTANVGTDAQDVSAITAIKAKYQVKKNWMGDPCVPKNLAWDGLSCSYAVPDPPRITAINLSSGGLSGDISFYFSKLTALEYLDLSHNKLTGSIPDVLSQLSSLKVIDLTDNQLNGSIPSGLLERIQDDSLKLRYGDNPNLCSNGNACQTKKKMSNTLLAVYIAVPIVACVVAGTVVLLLFVIRRNKGDTLINKPSSILPVPASYCH